MESTNSSETDLIGDLMGDFIEDNQELRDRYQLKDFNSSGAGLILTFLLCII